MNAPQVRHDIRNALDVPPFSNHCRTNFQRWRQIIGRASVIQRCEPGTMLLSACSPSRKSFLIERGVVALTHYLSTGKQVFLTLRSAGQIFGHSRHLLNHSFELSASALTSCVIWTIDSQWLIEQIKRGGEAGLLLMEQHAFDLFASSASLVEFTRLDAGVRLERFLTQFASAAGADFCDRIHVSLPLADGYLASVLGISAQQFSAVKRRLAAEGKVRHVRKTNTWILSSGKA